MMDVEKNEHLRKWVFAYDNKGNMIGRVYPYRDVKKEMEKHQEAIAFFRHLKNHKEVQEAPIHKGLPVCRICMKSSKEILSLLEHNDDKGDN